MLTAGSKLGPFEIHVGSMKLSRALLVYGQYSGVSGFTG